jgi:hypothetical protein
MNPLESTACRITSAKCATQGERIQSLWSGYGELVRMTLEDASISNVVVKHVSPPSTSRRGARSDDAISRARKLRSYAVEMEWYDAYATDCDSRCRVARLLGARHERDEWVLVMEDLDAAGFLRRVRSPARNEVESVLRWLAEFHATFMARRPEGLWTVGTYWHLGTRRNELVRIGEPALRAAAGMLDARLNAARFKTLVHGDAKIDNFCFAAQGQAPDSASVAAVDFQYVGGGCGIKDVVYFFSSIWNASECSACAEDALAYYFDAFHSALAERRPNADARAIQEEWQRLYPVAWADLQRFLCGWAPGQYDDDAYAQAMLRLATANPSTPRAADE